MLEVLRPFMSGRALIALTGVSFLLPVIWLFGPLLSVGGFAPLETEVNRMILCGALFVLCLLFIWLSERRKRRRDALLVQGISEPDPSADRAAEEEAELRDRLTTAMSRLKASSGKKGGFLYEQPWYVIIGPPGSGKTTALANSGLEFPLSDGSKLQGVGGTRLCEWWLSDNAVLIDTAGRYTSQDSDASADKAGWERFLTLLKKCAPAPAAQRRAGDLRRGHDLPPRRRRNASSMPAPCAAASRNWRRSSASACRSISWSPRPTCWPASWNSSTTSTRPRASRSGASPSRSRPAARPARRRSSPRNSRRWRRACRTACSSACRQERGPQQRAALAGFPAQFASLEGPLAAFIAAAFGGTRLDPAPMLRGVYFTSGTQEGSPLDRLAGALSRSFGLDPRRPASVMQQKGRAYFIARLLKDVVFNEARLASGDRAAAKRRRYVAIGAWSLAGLLVAGGGLYGYTAWSAEQTREQRLAEQIGKAEQAAAGLPFERITEAEFRRILPYMDAARDLPPAARGDGGGLGLSQEEKLVAGANFAYRRALDRSFLPRMLARLEFVIRSSFQRPEELYDATRTYLMLGQEGPLDAETVRAWFARDWQRAFPGQVNQPVRDALMGHLDATIARNFHRYPVDGALVDGARRIFSRLPLADRVFSRLQNIAAAQTIAPWKPADALGQAGEQYFLRASGVPLTEGIPGLYTIDGLYRGLLPVLGQAVREGVAEYWVLGAEGTNLGTDDPVALEQAVLRLYAEEYIRQWQTLLDDLNITPLPPGLAQQAAALNLLGAPNSPIKDLLRGIARQLNVGTPPQGWVRPGGQPRAAPAAGQPAQPAEPTGAEPAVAIIDPRFEALRNAAGEPLDGVLRIVNDLFVQVQRLATAPPGTLPPPAPGLDPGQRLQAEAARQPQPLQRWLNGMVGATSAARGGGAKAALAAAGAQQLAPFCRGLDRRFPFNVSGDDLPVDDFRRLFGPGGVFDQFFTQNIRQYVDTTSDPWRLVATDGLPPPISAADLRQFERARAIRDAFFPSAMSQGLNFELVPRGMDPGAFAATLEAEGTRTEITQGGAARPIAMAWPARGNTTLTFDPPSLAGPLAFDGAWSAMRLVLRRGSSLARTNSPERLRLRVTQGERSMDFELRAGSSRHPFGLRELQEFRCPTLAP